ncbi:hypothetical protein DICPUDRAFT_148411 [Dictyostelium purpureum]|uniref:RRM domain-containing protein n=1 Tax=Dictyostelium purpureum TaxID=5786 RepID=F0ZB22_DICPU|nr:uncharacterized protein DICPUDRAFT_148411 [Dictyostelium purpureum]EGC38819.1 hypothetical protein DICPUDRAFT_148411 [Dictyostelium purpureum]|eukprot:XP_003284613.1 hypothetical protein DICPUDRAFT_148411 [Dictyostelium purpureum]
MDAEQIRNQYSSVSLDDIVKQDRKEKKRGRGFTKNNNSNNNNNNNNNNGNGSPKTESPKLNVLESSLDDIVKSNQPGKKPYIKKTQNYNNNNQQNLKVTFKNNMNNNNRPGYQQQEQYPMNGGRMQFNNKGLFNRNNNMNNRQFSPPQHRGKFVNHRNNNKLKNIPRTRITDSIDHTFFDPRGIRDYSNVKKPTTASMNKPQQESEDVDEPEYDEHGNELSYSVKVVNLPKTVIQSDIAYIFGVIGALKDFELDNEKCEATVIFKKKAHALASIERYNAVELDNSLLILYEIDKPLTKNQIDEKIANATLKKEQQQQQDEADVGDLEEQYDGLDGEMEE